MQNNDKGVFDIVDNPRVKRSGFDLSHEYKTTHDFFDLIPISVIECVPADVHKIGVSAVLRFQPLVAPILHRVKMKFYSFFVPYRLLDTGWEAFITRNPDGNHVGTLPLFNPADYASPSSVYAQGSLWDYLGYPLLAPPSQVCPLDYPRRAYYKIFNDFFRDENLETEIDYTNPATNSYNILRSAWSRDLYTAALPFRQKGTAPALPVFGSANATFSMPWEQISGAGGVVPVVSEWRGDQNERKIQQPAGLTVPQMQQAADNFNNTLTDNNVIPGGSFTSADISDLRLASQVQGWLERNARGGTRYVEFLRNQFGTSPTDETLQRPVFIGGVTSDILVSEVLQTSATSGQPSPQGNLAGHGLGLARGFMGSYRVKEFGLIMTFATVAPTPAYMQGIDRAWLRRTTYDFPFPIFASLSEQEVFNAEVYTLDSGADPTGATNRTPFGYTGRYNELRYVPNRVTNEMRNTFDYWHLARKFASAPSLNSAFVRPTSAEITELKRVFAAPSVPGLIASYGINLQSYRPIPFMAVPSTMGGI